MLVNEILNKKVDYEVMASSSSFKTRAEIGGRMIEFSAERDEQDEYGFWELAFGEFQKNGKKTYAVTGSGNELEVFAMVKDSILEMISRYHPARMFFTSQKADNGKDTSRSSLYARLLKKFKVPGYTIETEHGKDYDQFVIVQDKYADN